MEQWSALYEVSILFSCCSFDLLYRCILTRFYITDAKYVPTATVVEVRAEKKSLLDGIEPLVRACGDGYAEVYTLPNGQLMSEGNNCYSTFKKAGREMDQWLKTADRIIEGWCLQD